MTPRFEKMAILGLGLLGASVARAARRAQVVECIAAASRRRGPMDAALAAGVVDEIGGCEEVVRGADLVVLCSPIGAMAQLVEAAGPGFRSGALVTDVGSVKGVLADRIPAILPEGVEYIGSHPMAGSHERGAEHARADLFDGAACVLTPRVDTKATTLARLAGFWETLGARVVTRTPEQHDVDVAWVSHAPHVVAFAFAHAFQEAPERAADLAGSGFRDFTRIAQSDSEMWSEILNANRKALSGPLQSFGRSMAQLGEALEAGEIETHEEFLAQARQALEQSARLPVGSGAPRARRVKNARSGGENPEISAGMLPANPRSVENDS
ncbi:MAG: prephenate dehydrogenase [Myxococcota bacterium]|nr:prephenate dehydrogenase [Myxococcota bacterium]